MLLAEEAHADDGSLVLVGKTSMKTSQVVQIGSDSSAKRQKNRTVLVLAAFFVKRFIIPAMDAVESVKWVEC